MAVSYSGILKVSDAVVQRNINEFRNRALEICRRATASSPSQVRVDLQAAANVARERFLGQMIEAIERSEEAERHGAIRSKLLGFSGALRDASKEPLSAFALDSAVAPAARPLSPARIALGAWFGMIAAYCLLSPHWAGPAITTEAALISEFLKPVVTALGAFGGVYAIMKPLPRLGPLEFLWRLRSRFPQAWAVALAFERKSLIAVGIGGFILIVLLLLWLVLQPKEPYVLLGVASLFALVATRVTQQDGEGLEGSDRDPLRYAVREFAAILRGDAKALATYAVVLGEAPFQKIVPGEDGKKLKTIAELVGRAAGREPDEIVGSIRDLLGISRDVADGSATPSEFTWATEFEKQYRTIGIVKPGQLVRVMKRPVLGEGVDGQLNVIAKGEVLRKEA